MEEPRREGGGEGRGGRRRRERVPTYLRVPTMRFYHEARIAHTAEKDCVPTYLTIYEILP